MSFSINTNSYALNASARTNMTNREISSSLEKLSSGNGINKAADDASGLLIANNLRMQASSLNQATSNAKSAVNLVQIADNALEEVDKILTTIKSKAIQSAEDGQTSKTRLAIQKDVNRLVESLDNISKTTKYNGQNLLSGAFANKEFQVGAYSNETIKMSIASTDSNHVGHARIETYDVNELMTNHAAGTESTKVLLAANNGTDLTINGTKIKTVEINNTAGTGVGALAKIINDNTATIGVRADYDVSIKSGSAVEAGALAGLTINGVVIGDVTDIKANDEDGKLANAINSVSHTTGVVAHVDEEGKLNLNSSDGRAIMVETTSTDAQSAIKAVTAAANTPAFAGFNSTAALVETGTLTLTSNGAKDIAILGALGVTADVLTDARSTGDTIDGAGAKTYGTGVEINNLQSLVKDSLLLTKDGAMKAMDIVDAALETIDSIRSDIGSVQQQLNSTINNITITAANVQIAEGGIRDVDFAAESANFNKNKLLAQSGTYALSQANEVQQNIASLLR